MQQHYKFINQIDLDFYQNLHSLLMFLGLQLALDRTVMFRKNVSLNFKTITMAVPSFIEFSR